MPIFASADLPRLHIVPPLNYNGGNAAADLDFSLGVTITVTDTTAAGSDTYIDASQSIEVAASALPIRSTRRQ